MSTQTVGAVPTITVAHRLRIAREFAGLDQDQLGALLGVTRGPISRAERGQGHTRAVLMAWALATGVQLSWLETGATPSDDPTGPRSYTSRDSNPEPAGSVAGLVSADLTLYETVRVAGRVAA